MSIESWGILCCLEIKNNDYGINVLQVQVSPLPLHFDIGISLPSRISSNVIWSIKKWSHALHFGSSLFSSDIIISLYNTVIKPFIPKVFSAKLLQSTQNLIKVFKLFTSMKLIRTPETHNFTGDWVKFSTSRKDGELYYKISQWDMDKTSQVIIDQGKVRDEIHLQELQHYGEI